MPLEQTEYKCTRQEATKLLMDASENAKFFVYILFDAPHANDTALPFKNVCGSSLELSREIAIELVRKLLKDRDENKGARIPIMRDCYGWYWIG